MQRKFHLLHIPKKCGIIKLMTDELIKQYQQTGSKEIENQLLDLHKDYIRANVNKWAGIIPQTVLEAHGKNYAIQGFKTYDPTKGANINTHLYNNISQLSRIIYQHQNASSIPENLIQQIGRVKQAKNYLTDELNREPTDEEIADHMHQPLAHIQKTLKYNRADLINDSDRDVKQETIKDYTKANEIFAYRQELPDKEKKQFDALTGFGNAKVLAPGEFGKKFKLKPYEVSRLKAHFAKGLK